MIAYKAGNKAANCTFVWNESTKTYVSKCSDNATTTTATIA